MFEVGRNYEFRMIEGGDEVLFSGWVAAYEPPLLKLVDSASLTMVIIAAKTGETISETTIEGGPPGRIINVHSVNFISAREAVDFHDAA